MRSWRLLLLSLLLLSACESLLGIEERKLDVAQLTADGYEGCEPSEGICEGCTSDWHTCICEGWNKKDEARLRVDCAELAPESIRKEEIKKAEKNLEESSQGAVVTNPFLKGFDQNFCREPLPDDACLQCFCGDCGDSADACAADEGCRAIMTCTMEADCDPTTEEGPGSCAAQGACGGVIDENGTLGGAPYEKFKAVMKCTVDERCPCGEGPVGPQPGGPCDAQSGCACGNCWDRCFCEGKDQRQCQQECGNANCTPEQQCADCVDCMDSCLCAGTGDPAACSQMCSGGPPPPQCTPIDGCNCQHCFAKCQCEGRTSDVCLAECSGGSCTADNGCATCSDCVNRCICEGGDEKSCVGSCPPLGPNNCDPLNNCQGCETCVGTCACEGKKPFHECLTSCDVAACDDTAGVVDCATCNTCVSECGCEGKEELDCRIDCVTADCSLTFADQCDQCACDRCGFEFAACEDQPGCPEMMTCVARTGCLGALDCGRPEACQKEMLALGGNDSPSMGLVEALRSCRQAERCPCFGLGAPPPVGQPVPVKCGNNDCSPFVPPPPGPIALACCAGADSCGLEMSAIVRQGNFCAPVNGPGGRDKECPDHQPNIPPWKTGQVLAGCCRPEGRCGFIDSVMNLGCASGEAFGIGDLPTCTP